MAEYYRVKSNTGRDTEYTPESFLEKANEYFQWCEDNPLEAQEIVKYRDSHTKDTVSKLRPFTIEGFAIYADICTKTFYNYESRPEFLHIVTRIKEIIRNQKFEGAASGFFNPSIIARDLGLRDNQDITTNGANLSTLSTEELIIRASASKKIE